MSVNKQSPRDVQSVHRALDLLESVGRHGDVGVSDVARELGLAVSTVHNLLRTLTSRGYLFSDHGRYRLGTGIAALSSQFEPTVALPSLLKPELARLSATTGQAAVATVLVGSAAQLVGYESSPGAVTATAQPWDRRTPLSLATGRVLVAMSPAEEWSAHIASAGDIEPGWSHAGWSEYLGEIARTGMCVKVATKPHNDVIGIAVPVWAGNQVAICAIGCSIPAYFASHDLLTNMAEALWDTSIRISGTLGCDTVPYSKPPIDSSIRTAMTEGRGDSDTGQL